MDGLSLLTATFNHKIEEWNLETGEILEPFPEKHSGAILSLQLSPSGEEILTGSADNNVILWRKSTRSPVRTFFGHHTDTVTAIETSDDLSLLLTASADKTVKVWNTETFELIKTLDEHTETVNAISRENQKKSKHISDLGSGGVWWPISSCIIESGLKAPYNYSASFWTNNFSISLWEKPNPAISCFSDLVDLSISPQAN